MKIKVTKDNVTIDKDELYHAGEYNIHNCTFEFSKEYTDILVKKALFGVDGKFYEMSILNNQCEIPYDVLKSNGMVILGVYAYEVLEDKLKLRYSPMYDKFFVNLGSYQENIENQEEITTTQFEQYMQALQNGLAEVQSSIDKLNKTTDNANNLVDEINKKVESGEFDGVGITTITSGQATQQDDSTVTQVTVNKTDGSQQTFNVSAKNGINGTDGTDGTNGQDGITPNLQIGTVTTLEPNEQATVTRTGTDENPILNFGIPKGQTYQVNKEDLDNIANQITSNANSEFNKNVDSKTTAFNNNAAQKTLDYNNNCISKTNSFNQNSTQKLTEFNDNYTSKLNSFNSNADLRMDEYNANADNKIAEYDEHSQELNNKIIDTRNELERVKNDVLETGTDTDTYIHLEDSAMAEYQELSVDGVCEQETTNGKNSFMITDLSQLNINALPTNLTINKTNNIISFTSVNSNNNGIYILADKMQSYIKNVDITKNYYISADITVNSNANYRFGWEGRAEIRGTLKTGTTRLVSKFTPTTAFIFYLSSTNVTAIISNIMISESKDTTYEPYTGGQPSPSPDYPQPISTIENSLSVTSCNKNLFDVSKLINGVWNNSYAPTRIIMFGRRVEKGEKITITNINNSSYKFAVGFSKLNECNQNNILINESGWITDTTYTIIANGNGYLFLQISKLNNSDILPSEIKNSDFQIEFGTTPTPFEEHLQSQITANLPEGEFIGKINDTYKDSLKVEYNEEDGQYHLVLNKMIDKVILNGTNNELYGNSSTDYYWEYFRTKFKGGIGTQKSAIVNYLNQTINARVVILENGTLYLRFPKSSGIDVSTNKKFNEWAKDHNVIIYYALKTPYTVDLGVVDMPLSYDDITNIFTDSDLMPQINAKYYRNFITTIQNLQVNEKALKQELVDINTRLSALENATTNVASESEVVE